MTQITPSSHSPARRQIFVTSALPYANGSVHIGHIVEYVQTDIWVRFQRMRGHECLYFCADDTHGTPIMMKARELGIEPEEYVARSQAEHVRDFKDFEIEFDHYSSTHSAENRELVNEFYVKMRDKGHTAVRPVQQLYCEHDKLFLPDRFVKGTCPVCQSPDQYGDSCDKCGSSYSPGELKQPFCAICKTPPVRKSSDHVFFKLNDFRSFLLEWVPKHTQKDVATKLMEWFDEDLRDWDISRDDPYFGFEIPDHEGKYFYVWVDAPIGYLSTALQWFHDRGRDFKSYWEDPNTEVHHFIGKDITYFHSLFWPAMLKAADYRQPTRICVHGHLTVNGEKMSKSKGTSITARGYLNHLDPMYLRYYYACKLTGSVNDLDLNISDFANRVNSDLIGKITNLGSRGAQMLKKRIDGELGALSADGRELVELAQSRSETIAQHYENRDYAKALTEIRDLADECNTYFDGKAPWNTIKNDVEATRAVLTATLNVFRVLAIYLKPVLPSYADKVARLLNEPPYQWIDARKTLQNTRIADYEHLATRVAAETFHRIIEESKPAQPEPPGPVSPGPTVPAAPTATNPKTGNNVQPGQKVK